MTGFKLNHVSKRGPRPQCVNSSPRSAAYMHHWIGLAFVETMACRQVVSYSAPSHYLNQCWVIVNWTLKNKLPWNFNQNTKLFIHKNASANIFCKLAAILSRGRWGNNTILVSHHTHPLQDWSMQCWYLDMNHSLWLLNHVYLYIT